MRNIPHEIIGYLFEHYMDEEQPVLLNQLAYKLFAGKPEMASSNMFRLILESFESKGYIVWSTSTYSEGVKAFLLDDSYKKELGKIDRHGKGLTLKIVNVRASLTPSGIDYAIDINRKGTQHTLNAMAIIFAGLAFVLSLITLIREITKDRQRRESKQTQTEQLQLLDSTVRKTTADLSYLIQARRNDSVSYISKQDKKPDSIR